MSSRRIEVFFYGLFMDADFLRGKGADPINIRAACVPGFALRIGQRATLLRIPDARVYGILMELTHVEIEQLYAEASVRAYRPEAVLAELTDGSRVPALCFNLLVPLVPKRPTQNTQRRYVIWRADWDCPLVMQRVSGEFTRPIVSIAFPGSHGPPNAPLLR